MISKSKDGSVTICKEIRIDLFTQTSQLMSMISRMANQLISSELISNKSFDNILENTANYFVNTAISFGLDAEELMEGINQTDIVPDEVKLHLQSLINPGPPN